MKIFKILLVVLAGVAVLVAAGAVLAVYYVQNNDLRGVAMWAAKKQGVPLQLGGPVRVQLLPDLIVKVQKVSVGALQGEGRLFDVDAAALRMKWGGGVTPWKGMQLIAVEAKNPTVTLKRDKNGVANWMPSIPDEPLAEAPADGKVAGCKVGEECTQLPMLVAARLAVANLNLTYDDAVSGQSIAVRDMDLMAQTEGNIAVTKLSGSVNGKAVRGEMRVDVGDVENIPVTAKIDAAGLRVAVDGRVMQQKEFAGLVRAESDDLRATLDALLGKAPPQVPGGPFKLMGDVTAGAERVVLRNFSTVLGDLLKVGGNVDVALGAEPSASGKLTASGNNLRALAELGSGTAQPSVPALPFTLSTNLSGKDAIVLQNLNLGIGSVATVAGDVRVVPPAATGGQPELDAQLALKVNNVQALGRSMGVEAALPAEAMTGRVTLKADKGTYKISTLEAQLADVLRANAKLDVVPGEKLQVNGSLAVTGDNVQSAAKAFGMDSSGLPASAFKVSAAVAGQGVITLDDLVVDLPQLLEAKGKLEVTPGTPTNVNGDLNVTRVNGDALGYCSAPAAPASAPPVEAATTRAADTPWSDEPLNLEALRAYAVDMDISVAGITCSNFPARSVKVAVTNTPSQLDVKGLSVSLADGGSLAADATLEHAGTPRLRLKMTGEDVAVEELAPTLKAKGVALALDMQANLDSVGASTRALARNLGGNLLITSDKGRIPYGNMVGNLANLQRKLSGDEAIPNNGNGEVDSLRAQYAIKQGVAATETFVLSTNGGTLKMAGTGTIDIGNWVIDYTLTPTLTGGDALSIPVLVKGPLGGPSIGADPAFVQKLTGRVAGEALQDALGLDKEQGKGVGGVVGDVLSGKGISGEGVGKLINSFVKPKEGASPTTASPTQGGAPKPNAADLLRGVLGR